MPVQPTHGLDPSQLHPDETSAASGSGGGDAPTFLGLQQHGAGTGAPRPEDLRAQFWQDVNSHLVTKDELQAGYENLLEPGAGPAAALPPGAMRSQFPSGSGPQPVIASAPRQVTMSVQRTAPH